MTKKNILELCGAVYLLFGGRGGSISMVSLMLGNNKCNRDNILNNNL